jgi:hypothetical protein
MASKQAKNIETLRNEAIKQEVRSYGARVDYAHALNDIAESAWFLPKAAKDTNVETERVAYIAGLQSINHSNPHQAWKKIKEYALADAQERGLFGQSKPQPADESDGDDKAAPRSLDLRLLEELTKLYKACKREVGLTTTQEKVCERITQALLDMGVNLSMITK